MLVLVTYDVATSDKTGQRRLQQVAKCCLNHGQRVQYSVFECLVTAEQWSAFRHRLVSLIDQDTDSLRFYFLGNDWHERVEHVGSKRSVDLAGPLII